MNITKRYVHPQERTILEAMERVSAQVIGGHTDETAAVVPVTASALLN
jgi:hypothetical protein